MYKGRKEGEGGNICALELQYDNRDLNTRDESSNSFGSEISLTPRNKNTITFHVTKI